MPDPAERRSSVTGQTSSVDLDKRTIRHWASKPSKDSYKTILLPKGCRTERFWKDPGVYINHSYVIPRDKLGVCLELQPADDGVIALTRVAARPPTLPEAVEWMPDTVLWLHSTRDLQSWSVGFDPLKYRGPNEVERSIEGGEDLDLIHEEWLLLEYSAVGIGANEDANTLSRWGVSDRLIRWMVEDQRPLELGLLKREMPPSSREWSIPAARVKDDEGHEHSSEDGKFVSQGGGGKSSDDKGKQDGDQDSDKADKGESKAPVKSKAKVSIAGKKANVVSASKKVFGDAAAYREVASLVGAPDDASVAVEAEEDPFVGHVIKVQTTHADYTSTRTFYRDDSGLVCSNDEFWVSKDKQGSGIGSDVFGRQVENAIAMGVSRIECYAAKENPQDSANPHNGYYTWPRMGYDVDRSELEKRANKTDKRLAAYEEMSKKFGDFASLHDVMATPEGREFWKKNGWDVNAKFDLKEGSNSLQIFNAYMEERKSKARSATRGLRENPSRGVEGIFLNEAEEAALERAWARLERKSRSVRVKDDEGHEHDDDGKFTGSGGGAGADGQSDSSKPDGGKEADAAGKQGQDGGAGESGKAEGGKAEAGSKSGQEHKTVGDIHGDAAPAAKSWLGKLKELPKAVIKKARAYANAKYQKLKTRYGKGMAKAIMAAGILGLPIPVPMSSLITAAPVIAVAEIYRAIHGAPVPDAAASLRAEEAEDAEMTVEEIKAAATEFMADLLGDEWAGQVADEVAEAKQGEEPEGETKSRDVCPECSGEIEKRCRCMIGHRTCINGHEYVRCKEHGDAKAVSINGKHPVCSLCFGSDAETRVREFSCVMAAITGETAEQLRRMSQQIAVEDIDPEDGLTSDPHVTVRYGLHENDIARMTEFLRWVQPFEIRFGKLKTFEADDNRPNSDCLVMEIQGVDPYEKDFGPASPAWDPLSSLHHQLGALGPHTDTYDEYRPHLTLGYVKKGKGKKYVKMENPFEGKTYWVETLVFSPAVGAKTTIELTTLRSRNRPEVSVPVVVERPRKATIYVDDSEAVLPAMVKEKLTRALDRQSSRVKIHLVEQK